MRRTSINQVQAERLAHLLRAARLQHQLSVRQLAVQSGVDAATILRLERSEILTPQPSTLKALATVLDISMSDLLVITEWLPAHELTTLKPFFRAKYSTKLTHADLAELDAYAHKLAERHGATGPIDHEDELP